MTQKKLGRANLLALQIKSIASSLRYDAKDYDCSFPLQYANRLEQIADEYLKLK